MKPESKKADKLIGLLNLSLGLIGHFVILIKGMSLPINMLMILIYFVSINILLGVYLIERKK